MKRVDVARRENLQRDDGYTPEVAHIQAWETFNIDQKRAHLEKLHNIGVGGMGATEHVLTKFITEKHDEDHEKYKLGRGPSHHKHTSDITLVAKDNLSYILPPNCTCSLRHSNDRSYPRYVRSESCPFHQLITPPPVNARIRLLSMGPDPTPLPTGTEGWVVSTQEWIDGTWQISVEWTDSSSRMNLVSPPDMFEVVHHG